MVPNADTQELLGFTSGPAYGDIAKFSYDTAEPYPLTLFLGNGRPFIVSGGNTGLGVSAPTEKLEVDGTVVATAFRGNGGGLSWTAVLATASGPGTEGQVAFDGSYIYRCTATDTWQRAPLAFDTW